MMKHFLLAIFTVLLFLKGQTQGYQPDKLNPKAVKLYEKAIEVAQGGDFKQGIDLLGIDVPGRM